MNFDQDVLGPLRRWMGRGLRTSAVTRWECDDLGAEGVRITVTFPASAFAQNVQEDVPAAAFFAVCFAYWHERRTGRRTRARARVDGVPGDGPHATRLRFVLHELAAALPGRFSLDPPMTWPLPERLVMNKEVLSRDTPTAKGDLSEAAVERRIAGTPALWEAFSRDVAPVSSFRRQLPLGLFVDEVAVGREVLPRGAAQVDLWGVSPDERVLHLVELKTRGNSAVGILPEALTYARLLHHVRLGRIRGDGDGLAAARRAERIVMWLVAPDYHPLVLHGGDSPVVWLNEGMAADGVELRVLPIDLGEDGAVGWRGEKVVGGRG